MNPRLLLDTHILIHWLSDFKKLSREQRRAVEDALQRGECLGLSAMSVLEIALLSEGKRKLAAGMEELFQELDTNPVFQIIPLTTDIAREVAALGNALRDPGDRVIVATARVHRLRLLTADQRTIDSGLVPVIE